MMWKLQAKKKQWSCSHRRGRRQWRQPLSNELRERVKTVQTGALGGSSLVDTKLLSMPTEFEGKEEANSVGHVDTPRETRSKG